MTALTTHASESTHWYWPDGRPCYEIMGKNGPRPTTLRDARTLGLLPSVTTIIKEAAAPGLELWKQRQAILAALTLPWDVGEADDAFVGRVLADAREQAKQAAELGTRVHGSLERATAGAPLLDEADAAAVGAAFAELRDAYGAQGWRPEDTFAHPSGFGGKVDLWTEHHVVDVKTKAFIEAKEVGAYDEHVMQLAAYRHGLRCTTARCANLFVSTTVPGLVRLVEHTEAELVRGWAMFEALLWYHQARTGHRPRVAA